MSSRKQGPFYITWCLLKGVFRQKKLSVQAFNSVCLYNYNNKQKSWDTSAFVRLFFNSHMPNPYPTPQTTLDACIQNFSEFQHCIGWGKGELQKNFGKDAQRVFYKGFQKLQKIINNASLH